jgi:glyoxalase family protein
MIVAHKSAKDKIANVWKDNPIPVKQATRGFYSVTLSEEGYERTASVLIDELGFTPTLQDVSRFRYEIPMADTTVSSGDANQQGEGLRGADIVDIVCSPYTQHAITDIGSVHHVA